MKDVFRFILDYFCIVASNQIEKTFDIGIELRSARGTIIVISINYRYALKNTLLNFFTLRQ